MLKADYRVCDVKLKGNLQVSVCDVKGSLYVCVMLKVAYRCVCVCDVKGSLRVCVCLMLKICVCV